MTPIGRRQFSAISPPAGLFPAAWLGLRNAGLAPRADQAPTAKHFPADPK